MQNQLDRDFGFAIDSMTTCHGPVIFGFQRVPVSEHSRFLTVSNPKSDHANGMVCAVIACCVAVGLTLAVGHSPAIGAPGSASYKSRAGDEARAQMILPLAFGGDSGRRSGATDTVRALADSPETPTEELSGTIGQGDGFLRFLERAGVGSHDRNAISKIVGRYMDMAEIEPGTRIDLVLGTRGDRNSARPIESISFRARLDLALKITRGTDGLIVEAQEIAVDSTPMRISGTIDHGIYNSARAAGAPIEAIESYLEILDSQGKLEGAGPGDEFDMIIAMERAATGETRVGSLLYAGLKRGGKHRMQMLQWKGRWFEASGVGKTRGAMMSPVSGRISSHFGMRRHPILGYMRLHGGTDFAALSGTPIYASADGVVNYAGRNGGHGNYVRIDHGKGLATGYSHMSRIAAQNGQHVRQGQIIGYVGSTGLSTGPHLHYEMYRGGQKVNPLSVKFIERAELEGAELTAFRRHLATLTAIPTGVAKPTRAKPVAKAEPVREIDLLAKKI